MAISFSREQTRLAKSQEAGKAVLNDIVQTQTLIKNLQSDLDQLSLRNTLEENTVAELNSQLMSLSVLEVKTDETVADIARIANEIKQHQVERDLALSEYATKAMERDAAEIKLATLLNGPTMLRISSQEKALAKQEAAYPKLLKRHLRKCRKHGWADGRLAAAKAKK